MDFPAVSRRLGRFFNGFGRFFEDFQVSSKGFGAERSFFHGSQASWLGSVADFTAGYDGEDEAAGGHAPELHGAEQLTSERELGDDR